jgi:hypothetical protein
MGSCPGGCLCDACCVEARTGSRQYYQQYGLFGIGYGGNGLGGVGGIDPAAAGGRGTYAPRSLSPRRPRPPCWRPLAA